MIKFFKCLEKIVDFIFPPVCPLSGQEVDRNGMLHVSKWKEISFISKPFCNICGIALEFDSCDGTKEGMSCASCIEKRPVYNIGRSAIHYNEGSKELILKFKHGDKSFLACSIAPMMVSAGEGILNDVDYLVPVPLHRFRLFKRKYNQAAILSKLISKQTGIAHLPNILHRNKATKNQGEFSGKMRIQNVKNAFSISKKYPDIFKGKNIVIIDDVYTTGATISECAKIIINKGGANRVDVLTFARV